MATIQTLLLVLQVIVAITLIGFILIQHGKGADAGAAFGSGASATVFGSRGSGNFMTRVTTILAIVFLANSLFLSYVSNKMVGSPASLLENEPSVILPQIEDQTAADVPVEEDTSAAPAAADMPQDIQDKAPVETSSAPMDVPAIEE
jgi:preprotein translocase subunit SecG